MIAFFNKFPKVPSHYGRKQSTLYEAVLYHLYLGSECDPKVSERIFCDMLEKILNTNNFQAQEGSMCLNVTAPCLENYIDGSRKKKDIRKMPDADLAVSVSNQKLV